MKASTHRQFEFGPFVLQERERRLIRDGLTVAVTPKAFDVLLLLVENSGSLVEKSRLMSSIWPDTYVEENTLTRNVADLRKALGPGWIETVPKFGYRFSPTAREIPPAAQEIPRESSRKFMGWAVAAVAALVLALLVLIQAAKTNLRPARWLGQDSGLRLDPAISPTGDRIAYASDQGGDGNLDIWVRSVSGGGLVRLTRNSADDREPAFSPDGRTVAFFSEREGGGVYTVRASGGPEKLLAPRGQRPQFSPDGHWIAYWEGTIPSGIGRVYVIPARGGMPRRIDGSCGYAAGSPVWAPDSRTLLFWCKRPGEGTVARDVDWWVAGIEGGTEAKTHATAVLEAQSLAPDYEVYTPSAWIGNQIVFAAARAGKANLWRIAIQPGTWRVTGRAEQLTFSDAAVRKGSLAAGQLAYAAVSGGSDIWGLPVDADGGKVTGRIRRLTNDPSGADRPSVSANGGMMTYTSYRQGSESVWAKDMKSGVEWLLNKGVPVSFQPVISPDGSWVAFALRSGDKRRTYLASLDYSKQYARPRAICESCGGMWGWTPDGSSLLFQTGYDTFDGMNTLGLLDLSSLTFRTGTVNREVVQPTLSPDSNWLAFCDYDIPNTRRIFIAKFHDAKDTGPGFAPQHDWIPAAPGDVSGTSPVWSPDGSLIYFLSMRDGGRCIWAQRLDRLTKHTVGAPWEVYHMHQASRGVKELVEEIRIGLGLGGDQLIFAQAERSGSLWLQGFPQRSLSAAN